MLSIKRGIWKIYKAFVEWSCTYWNHMGFSDLREAL
jgi:hypothetical protein